MSDGIRHVGYAPRSASAAAAQALAPEDGASASPRAVQAALPSRQELLGIARRWLAYSAGRGLRLRDSVLLAQALKHHRPPYLPTWFGMSARAEGAADGKQRAFAPAGLPTRAGIAAQRARAFLEGRGVLATALPLERGYEISRTILEAAANELPDECLSYVTEALALQQQRTEGGSALQAMLRRSVIDRVGGSRFRFDQGAELVAGLLRPDSASEARMQASIRAMALRAFSGSFASFLNVAPPGTLFDTGRVRSALAVLAAGAGGPRMAPQHLQALLGVLPSMLRYVGPDDRHPIAPEDLAFILARLCVVMDGAKMPAPLREVAWAHVCSPRHAYEPSLRGAMVYQVGTALRLWQGPPTLQQEWLSTILDTAGLSAAHVGSMAWALGLHLAGNPVDEDWHQADEHIVEGSTAPAPRVVAALMALAERGPKPTAGARDRLVEGLRAVLARERLDDDTAHTLGWTTATEDVEDVEDLPTSPAEAAGPSDQQRT